MADAPQEGDPGTSSIPIDFIHPQERRLNERAANRPVAVPLPGRPLSDVERYYIEGALKLTDGNREEAAKMLGIGERTLYRKIQEHKQDTARCGQSRARSDPRAIPIPARGSDRRLPGGTVSPGSPQGDGPR